MRLRVLLAEDEALVALALADCLEAMGHAVTTAGDGEAALALANHPGAPRFDLLVTDLNMPRLGGEGLIRALWAARPGLPVVVVTGFHPEAPQADLRGLVGPTLRLCKQMDCGGLAGSVAAAMAAPAEPPRRRRSDRLGVGA